MGKLLSRRESLKTIALCSCGMALSAEALADFPDAVFKFRPMEKNYDVWKWSKPAHHFTPTDKGPRCGLCPNACIVQEGKYGRCKTRVAWKGDLYSIAYGNPCSVNVDPVEKKPLYHFLPKIKTLSLATAGCNFTCLNCQNWQISQVSPFDTDNYDLMPAEAVKLALKHDCKAIAYTYSEPVVFYEYMYDCARLSREKGLKNLLISNGYINDQPLVELTPYLDAANINLKSFSDEIYRKLNGGSLKTVMNTLKTLKKQGVWLEITHLVVPSWTDDPAAIAGMCEWLAGEGFTDTPLHFSRFHPTYRLTQLPMTPASILDKARDIALKAGIQYVYIGNVPGTPAVNTSCPYCGTMVVERKGFNVTDISLNKGNCSHCKKAIAGVWS